MNKPKWTVTCNWVNTTQWIGTHWEFFNSEKDAAQRYKELKGQGHCCTKRPFHKNDINYMGAAHR